MVRRGHGERPQAEYPVTEASVIGQGNAGSPQRGCAKTQQARVAPQVTKSKRFVLSLHNIRMGLCGDSFFCTFRTFPQLLYLPKGAYP